jgi:hypothetical protein
MLFILKDVRSDDGGWCDTTAHHTTTSPWRNELETCISDVFSWHQQRTFGLVWGSVHSLFWFTHYSNRSGESMSLNSLQVQQATPFNKTWIWSRLNAVHSPWRRSPKMTTFMATFLGQPGRLDPSVLFFLGRAIWIEVFQTRSTDLRALELWLSNERNALWLVMSAKWKVSWTEFNSASKLMKDI